MRLLKNIQKLDPEENVKHKIMKKPYLEFWQRQHIIHNTHLGAMLKVNLEMKKTMREILVILRIHDIVECLSKKL